MKTVFTFRQNNSGGNFQAPAVHVMVEASTVENAIKLTEPHFTLCGESGTYAEYDSCGCCPCCGHRWSKPWSDKPEDIKELIKEIEGRDLVFLRGVNTALIKKDGNLIIGDSVKNVNKILKYLKA
jgi:hypothetical protein